MKDKFVAKMIAKLNSMPPDAQREALNSLTIDEIQVLRLRFGLKIKEGVPDALDRVITSVQTEGRN